MSHFVLGVDLASRSWTDNGSALIELDRDGSRIACVVPGAIAWPTSSPLTAAALADAIDGFARSREVTAVALDGPAGWRDPETAPELPGVGRRSEHECRTQGKTGVYPKTYPGTQRGWIEHSIAVFAALLAKPGVVLAEAPGTAAPLGGYLLAECFPTSSWRSSKLKPLPGKGKRPALTPFIEALSVAFGLPPFSTASHDDLQGVVAALAALGALGVLVHPLPRGVPSRLLVDSAGQSRRVEGVIWDAMPLDGPHSRPVAMPAPASSPSTSPSPASSVASACVTSAIVAEWNRTGREGSMAIALRGTPAGTSSSRVKLALRIGETEHVLFVGDTHAAWRSHQTTPETEEGFERLFAELADQPDARVAIDEVRSLGSS